MKKFLIIPGVIILLIGLGLLIRDFITVPAREVKVTLTENEVRISTDLIAVNEAVSFIITNIGKLTLDVVLERVSTDNIALAQGEGQETASVKGILPGETHAAVWTITSPGQYQLASHLPGDLEQDIKQSFSVGTGMDESFLGSTGSLFLVGMGALLLAVTYLDAISISQQNRAFIYAQFRARPSK